MALKITILIDNYVKESKLVAEHGWSVMLEDKKEIIILDCGQSGNFLYNARNLNLNLEGLTCVVLSHGHYDHTGGLMELSRSLNKGIMVYAHPGIFDYKYKINPDKSKKYIGIPFRKEKYQQNGIDFKFIENEFKITKNIYLTGEVERESIFEEVDENFVKKENGFFRHDNIDDDISIIADFPEGIVLVTGCAHSGIINILKKASAITGKKNYLLVMGGLHLVNKDGNYIEKIIGEMRKYRIGMIVPAHCTGWEGICLLKKHFGNRCQAGYTGKVVTVKY